MQPRACVLQVEKPSDLQSISSMRPALQTTTLSPLHWRFERDGGVHSEPSPQYATGSPPSTLADWHVKPDTRSLHAMVARPPLWHAVRVPAVQLTVFDQSMRVPEPPSVHAPSVPAHPPLLHSSPYAEQTGP